MLAKLLKSTNLLQVPVIILTGILLWVPAFTSAPIRIATCSPAPAYLLVAQWIPAQSLFASASSCLLILVEAFLFNYYLSRNDLIKPFSYFPAFLFVMIMGLFPAMCYFHPLIPALLFIILGTGPLLSIYEVNEPYRQLYNAGLMAGIAALFYLPALGLALVLWIALLTYRITGWREWIIPLIGLTTVFLFGFSIDFIASNWQNSIMDYRHYLAQFSAPIELQSPPGLLKMGFVMVLGIAGILRIIKEQTGQLISIRKRHALILAIFFVSVAILPLCKNSSWGFFLLAPPLAYLISHYLGSLKKSWIAEILLFIIIISRILSDYQIF